MALSKKFFKFPTFQKFWDLLEFPVSEFPKSPEFRNPGNFKNCFLQLPRIQKFLLSTFPYLKNVILKIPEIP